MSRTWWSTPRILEACAELGTPQIQGLLELHSKVKVSLSNLEKHYFKILVLIKKVAGAMASSLSLWLLSLEDPRHLPGLSLTHTLNQTSLPVPAGSVPCCHDLPAYDTLSILTLNLCPTPSGSCLHHHPFTTQSREYQNSGAQLSHMPCITQRH